MENLSLLLLFVKKSVLVVGFVGIVSCGGLSGLFSKFSISNNDKGKDKEQIEWKVGSKAERDAPSDSPWWSVFF